jgi:predicted exporter
MISFGVDFYIHCLGRVREIQVEGDMPNGRAYAAGMTAVFTAMLLAVMSSIAAFLANAVSGTESIIEFGLGAAISLAWAYLLLDQLAPSVTVSLERMTGRNPKSGASKYVYGAGTLVMAVFGGLAVALSAAMPTIGSVALVVFLPLAIGIPVVAARRRNTRATRAGRELVEGDLLDPGNLEAIEEIVDNIDSANARFGRNAAGELTTNLHAGDLVRMTMDSPAVAAIEAAGHDLRDADVNGIPDTRDGVAAVFDYIVANGVPAPDGSTAVTPDTVPEIYADSGRVQATAVVVQMASFAKADVIVPAQEALEDAAAAYEIGNTNVTASVAGEVLTQFASMESFTRSMLVSLPLALLLTFLIASVMLRSIRYALVSVLPIGLVVIGVYAFMATFGYTVNVVTATIAAIAVGVGIDFSTHFTARFREELTHRGDRIAAVRAAGGGTGGTLVLSAITSVLGFAVMAMAPTPIFATFGLLTAVMIVLSLAVAILVLPSLLVVAKKQPSTSVQEDSRQPIAIS